MKVTDYVIVNGKRIYAGICQRCGSVKPVQSSCDCFDNGCQ